MRVATRLASGVRSEREGVDAEARMRQVLCERIQSVVGGLGHVQAGGEDQQILRE